MMVQVVGNLDRKVTTKDLASIHSEDLILNASVEAVLQQAGRIAPGQRPQFTAAVTNLAQHVAELHFAGDTRQQSLAEKQMALVREQFERIKSYFTKPTIASAEAAASRYTCPTHSEVQGQSSDHCSKFCRLLLPENR